MSASNAAFTVVIPARFSSSRLPGKPLIDICGKPMIQHVYERACESHATRVIIATDDERIVKVAESFDAEACMTLSGHPSGTDRLQEVTRLYEMGDNEVIVNVQGDEPLIPAKVIDQVANNLIQADSAGAATLSEPVRNREDLFNPNVVKVVTDQEGFALYFSRAPVPWARDEFADSGKALPTVNIFRRHIGIYAYRVNLLNQYVQWQQSPVESVESLEQLRLLWNGHRIHVADAMETPPHGVDTEDDLEVIRGLMENRLADIS